MRVKYLRYWWLAESEVDPDQVTEEYFRVVYDNKGRYVLVERYSSDHRLIEKCKYFWKRNKLVRTEAYGPNGTMEYYNIYRYGLLGNVRGIERYSPDGKLLRFETEGV